MISDREEVKRMEPTNHTVRCSVQNCLYNNSNHCTAQIIDVGPQYRACTAANSDETVCATFRPKT